MRSGSGPLAIGTSLALVPVLLGTTLVPSAAVLADEAVLIGGGYDPHGSQGQIELNVGWVRGILEEQDLPVTTFFTDGNAPGADVHHELPPALPASPLEPLARVFGDERLERRRYREHALPDVAGGTRRDTLEPALAELFARTADEPLLLVYNGHGGRTPGAAVADVTLELWDGTALSARELHALLGERRPPPRSLAPDGSPRAPFRFVFTQCFSGGFHRLAYTDPDTGLVLADAPRCGFTAESAHRLAEGCSAGIDIGDYRDYTTYFFAALADRERDGTVLDRDPDSDADGRVTLREAHLHALEKAWSSDLSRSTSEDWLERWQPWYLRWLPQPRDLPNNEYAGLFRTLATNVGLPLDARVGRTLRGRLAEIHAHLEVLLDERAALRGRMDEVQIGLQIEATNRWPVLLGPYTTAYRELAASGGLETAAAWLATLPDYATLVERQRRDAALDTELLDTERAETQIRKLLRLRRLAVLKGQLAAYGSASEQASYRALLACEETPLVLDPDAPGDVASNRD